MSFHVRFHRVLSGFYRPVGGLLPSWSHLIRFCINHRCRCRTGGNMKACLDRFACLLCFAMENMLSASSHAARRSMNNATGFCCCCCCCCCSRSRNGENDVTTTFPVRTARTSWSVPESGPTLRLFVVALIRHKSWDILSKWR